jgi:hypothetical protein
MFSAFDGAGRRVSGDAGHFPGIRRYVVTQHSCCYEAVERSERREGTDLPAILASKSPYLEFLNGIDKARTFVAEEVTTGG